MIRKFSLTQLQYRADMSITKRSLTNEAPSVRQIVKAYVLERSLVACQQPYAECLEELSDMLGEPLSPFGFVNPYNSLRSNELVSMTVDQSNLLDNFKNRVPVDRYLMARLSGIVWESATDLAVISKKYRVVDEDQAKLVFPSLFADHAVAVLLDLRGQLDNITQKLSQLRMDTAGLTSDDIALSFMYMNDSISKLSADAKEHRIEAAQVVAPVKLKPFSPKLRVKKSKLLVVGLWPRQYESLRLAFDKKVWDLLDITYVASDKHRTHRMTNVDNFDYVLCNASAVNHAIGDALISNLSSKSRYQLYEGGVSALKSIIIDKARGGLLGADLKQAISGH